MYGRAGPTRSAAASCSPTNHQERPRKLGQSQNPDAVDTLDSRSGRGFAAIRLGRFARPRKNSGPYMMSAHASWTRTRHNHDEPLLRAIALLGLGRLAEPWPRTDSSWVPGPVNSVPENISSLYARGNLARVLLNPLHDRDLCARAGRCGDPGWQTAARQALRELPGPDQRQHRCSTLHRCPSRCRPRWWPEWLARNPRQGGE